MPVVAVTQQESSFRTDPPVPQLAAIAWREIDKQAERVGIPRLVVRTALHLPSSNGKSYSQRIDAVKTERELSEIFEDFIGRVPMGKRFFAERNPVRTGGPSSRAGSSPIEVASCGIVASQRVRFSRTVPSNKKTF